MNIPIVFCFDDRILLGAGVSILSLIEAADDQTVYDIHILHADLAPSSTDALESLVRDTRHKMSFHRVSADRFADAPKNRGSWTEVVYFRLLISEILGEYDRAIYSDVDVFFKCDMGGLFQSDLQGAEWGGVVAERNSPDFVMHKHFPENEKEFIYFSGFMLMDLALMRRNAAVGRYFDAIRMFGDRLSFFDLDLLNIATPQIASLPFKYVTLEDIYESDDISQARDFKFLKSVYSVDQLEHERENPAIIHYAGPRGKPWQRRDVPDYYLRAVKKLPPALRKTTFRDFRKRLLGKTGRAHLVSRTPHQRLSPFSRF
ncbi:glycosyltransferase family 8 protein [Paracoccus sp. (in: a-proteobacteria)]|uniref:glycosyltransferase family 8 protein n=1 Tax=Paracoccus sp. TaxID=267 RepID=UPI0026E09E6F|nr:glycosyltransferase family 8 protein [Paracoccus sp. (in: a-proteobacteria)]MDO5648447.1 glycosyltransferase family 8 protein [Paracoccus sp. (in: a-proteobacteria)]